MASLGFIETMLQALEATPKKVLTQVFRDLVPNLELGPVEHQAKLTNFRGYFVTSTTATSTGEFSIAHGLSVAPHTAVPVLDLTSSGFGLVPLEVTRPADASRIYVKSSVTSRPFTLWME
jgi:hypothetical protein